MLLRADEVIDAAAFIAAIDEAQRFRHAHQLEASGAWPCSARPLLRYRRTGQPKAATITAAK